MGERGARVTGNAFLQRSCSKFTCVISSIYGPRVLANGCAMPILSQVSQQEHGCIRGSLRNCLRGSFRGRACALKSPRRAPRRHPGRPRRSANCGRGAQLPVGEALGFLWARRSASCGRSARLPVGEALGFARARRSACCGQRAWLSAVGLAVPRCARSVRDRRLRGLREDASRQGRVSTGMPTHPIAKSCRGNRACAKFVALLLSSRPNSAHTAPTQCPLQCPLSAHIQCPPNNRRGFYVSASHIKIIANMSSSSARSTCFRILDENRVGTVSGH